MLNVLQMGNITGAPQKMLFTAEKNLIQDLINKNCVVVFSKTHCIYCNRVKKLLNDSNISYEVVELDKHNDGKNLQDALSEMTGARTVPRVFINGACIGGAAESEQLHRQKELLKKVAECSNR